MSSLKQVIVAATIPFSVFATSSVTDGFNINIAESHVGSYYMGDSSMKQQEELAKKAYYSCFSEGTSKSFIYSSLEESKQSDLLTNSMEFSFSTVASILGEHSSKRLRSFQKYKKGWDAGRGQEMSMESVKQMSYFLSQYQDYIPKNETCVFMSKDGNIILNWPHNSDNTTVELEFRENDILLFAERDDLESVISYGDGNWLGYLSKYGNF